MLKVIVADNQAIFRAGMAKVLAVEDDIRVVAQAPTAEQARSVLQKLRPNVLIISAAFLTEDASLRAGVQQIQSKLVVLAENGENPQRYTLNGANAVLFRSVTGEVLVECVRKVAAGQSFVQELKPQGAPPPTDEDFVGARVRDRLTPKELRIVALIVQGYKNKEIALQLGTTEQVVKNYLRNVYDKIGVSDRLELALFTIHHRILAEAAAAIAAAMPPQ